MKDISKLLAGESSAPSKLSPQEIQAKLDVIRELMEEMAEAMGGHVKSGLDELGALKKVTVAAPDEESLEAGLDVAKEVLPEVVEKAEEAPVAEEVKPAVEDEDNDLYSLMQKKKKKMLG